VLTIKKYSYLILIVVLSFSLFFIGVSLFNNNFFARFTTPVEETKEVTTVPLEETKEITIVPTLKDQLAADTAWCGTLQLVWNDLKNKVVAGDIIYSPSLPSVEHLNQGQFSTANLPSAYYYTKYGYQTLALKQEIEAAILEKFGETSAILDQFAWKQEPATVAKNGFIEYFLYAMLKHKFQFTQKFDRLPVGTFGQHERQTSDVTYFGIGPQSDSDLGQQVRVLFYRSQADFALKITTVEGDEIVFYKNPIGETFDEMQTALTTKMANFKGKTTFQTIDRLKIPDLNLDATRNYQELTGRYFPIPAATCQREGFTVGDCQGIIEQALQTIKFKLDESGGEIISEVAIFSAFGAIGIEENQDQPRYFYLDDTFALFIFAPGQDVPYFAARIADITKYQSN
jgi:hypothetical protein